jgi:hypothetical protein
MKRLHLSLFAALAVTFVAHSHAFASFVPWTYNWSRSPVSIAADVPGTGGLSLTDEALNHAVGSSDIVATNIRSFSSALRTAPDTFTAKPYTLSLFLQDDASGDHTTISFSGAFSGSLSKDSANIKNVFTGLATQTVKLGSHTYSVAIGQYAPPGPPTASNAGSISAHVTIDQDPDPGTGTGGGTGGHEAPEPCTLVLGGVGLSLAGLAGLRRKLLG